MQRKRRLTCIGQIEKNEMIKSIMKRKVFFIQLSFRMLLFNFFFEKMSSPLPVLFVHVVKRSNSHSLMFSNQVFLKFCNTHRKLLGFPFNKVAGLNACIFIKKETPTQVLSCEYCEIFKNSFFVEHQTSIQSVF